MAVGAVGDVARANEGFEFVRALVACVFIDRHTCSLSPCIVNHPGRSAAPSLQVGNGQLMRDSLWLVNLPKRIALGIGTAEASPQEYVPVHLGHGGSQI